MIEAGALYRRFLRAVAAGLFAVALASPAAAGPAPRNVIIFVADGLRSRIVTPQTAPALAEVRAQGVDFQNSHSLYPTVTTPNASAIATGHLLGDTGDFGNTLYVGETFPPPYGTPVAGVEDDVMIGLLNQRYGGNYLGLPTLLEAARGKGYATAAIGKVGPTAIQDVTARDGTATVVIDDYTGFSTGEGLPLAPDVAAAIKVAGLPAVAPDRGLNTSPGAYNMPGVQVANVVQQDWFAAVATKVLLPRFKASGKPFVMVFWSRDPDGTQHNEGDSLNSLTPGINGPTSMAAIRNASNDLAALRQAVKDLGLEADTDIVVTADHGFATLSRESPPSAAAGYRYPDVTPGFLPPGFLAIDLAKALGLPLQDPSGYELHPDQGDHPKSVSLIGADARHPQAVVAANGGTDLIYLSAQASGADDRKARAARIVEWLTRQDYTGGVFVADDLGPIPGALPLSAVGLAGSARTPRPDIFVSFRSFSTGCADAELCAAEVADTDLQQGQGIHGSFGRHNTHNFMAAIGPDFAAGYVDEAPVSNADLAITLAHILGLDLDMTGHHGRVAAEALRNPSAGVPVAQPFTLESDPAANGFRTVLKGQKLGESAYFDAAGMPGRVVGLEPAPAP